MGKLLMQWMAYVLCSTSVIQNPEVCNKVCSSAGPGCPGGPGYQGPGSSTPKKKTVIDTNTRDDDAVGIFLALAGPEVEIIGITCTNGNVYEKCVEFNTKIICDVDKSKRASQALVDLAREYGKELTVVVLGPLTNFDEAITLDPNFVENVKKLIIVGSPINQTENIKTEYNFGHDPEADVIVPNAAQAKTLI